MTIEEKAKAYDDAVTQAKRVLDGLAEDYRCTYMTKDDIRNQYSRLFPNEVTFQDDEDSFANRKLIYGLKSLLQQGKETFAGVDIEDLINYLERKTSGKIVGVTLNGTPVPTENNAVNITPRFKAGDIIRFKGDPPSAPNHKVRVVEGDKYYLDNDKVLYLPFTAQDKWDFAATNRVTFTEGELKVIKDIIGYLDYKGMEDYHDSLENIMLTYGGSEK
jgi:hypothetical protein